MDFELEHKTKIEKIKNENVKLWFFVFLFLIIIDQLSKHYAHNIFRNSVFTFSLPLPLWLIYLVYFFVLRGMVVYCLKHYYKFSQIQTLAWLLIFAGAASNILERIILGYVRDWIYIGSGIFNLADGYIIVGIITILASRIKNPKLQIPNTK